MESGEWRVESREPTKPEAASSRKPREGWAEQFRVMAERGDDKLIDPETPTSWDESEWEWAEVDSDYA